jgi:hypothetical protein
LFHRFITLVPRITARTTEREMHRLAREALKIPLSKTTTVRMQDKHRLDEDSQIKEVKTEAPGPKRGHRVDMVASLPPR